MSAITTHVLDTSIGRPAADVGVTLERQATTGDWDRLGAGSTDADGRARGLMTTALTPGVYRLTFDSGGYFAARGVQCLFPSVALTFAVTDAGAHHHIPLLLGPFGYTTYRGS